MHSFIQLAIRRTAPTHTPDLARTVVTTKKSGNVTPFNNLIGFANGRSEFGQPTSGSGSGVGKIGNIGNPQGSNMIKISNGNSYAYTNTYINSSPRTMTVVIWNKAFDGSAGIDANLGAFVAPETPALTFVLASGERQVVAFQENSQVGWAEATASRTPSGAFDTTWGEANFETGGSGYDISAIMNSAGNIYDMAIAAEQTSCISDRTHNYWFSADGNTEDPQPAGDSDGSCYIPGTGATLITKMGGEIT